LGDVISWADQVTASDRFGVSLYRVEQVALEAGLLPSRYKRNRNTLSIVQQARLFNSTVFVAGCGGIGGNVIELLARLGVGNLILVDQDEVEDHNVNRQLLSSLDVVGGAKAQLAAQRVNTINPAIEVRAYREAIMLEEAENLDTVKMLQEADIVIDALDNIETKRRLARACGANSIPIIYGSVAGWYGQVATQFPGEDTIERICSGCSSNRGVEIETGNVSFGPAVVASIQAAEACKIITGQGDPLRGKMLFIDLLNMDIEIISI
jgi:molybdopterin/thiamine biosynthesis adenylyltransferase